MIFIPLFIILTLLWQDDFTETTTPVNQLSDNMVDIAYERGTVLLNAHPQSGDFASAWFSVDEHIIISDRVVEEKPWLGSDFPAALTPGKMPCLYIFIRNELPGNFDFEIDRIALLREESSEEVQ